MALTKTQVSQLYVAIFNRASEGEGNRYWAAQDKSAAEIANDMLATTDAKAYFGSSLDTNQAFVEWIYKNTLNKTATDDPDGIAYWVNQLESGKSKGEVVVDLVNAIASYADSTDPITKAAYDQFMNRVAVSDHTAEVLDKAPADYATTLSFGHNLVVTSDPATVTEADSNVDALVDSFTLTNKTDIATAGTFTAPMVYTPDGSDRIVSLQDEDQLTGIGDSATLNVVLGNTNADEGTTATVTPVLKNIANINIDWTGNTNTLDLRYADSVKTINIDKMTSDVGLATVQNITTKASELSVSDVHDNTSAVVFDYVRDVLSGNDDELNLSLDNVLANSIIVQSDGGALAEGYETVNLSVKDGVDIRGLLSVAEMENLVVDGEGRLDILNLIPTSNEYNLFAPALANPGSIGQRTIDLSGFSGKSDIDISLNLGRQVDPDNSGKAFYGVTTGGSGDDTFHTNATIAGNDATDNAHNIIDGGAGNNTVVSYNGNIVNDAEIKNVQTLELRDQNGAVGFGVTDMDAFDDSLSSIVMRGEDVGATTFTLNDMTVAQAENMMTLRHSISVAGVQTVNANLKDATGASDTMAISIVNDKNTGNTFNYTLGFAGTDTDGIAANVNTGVASTSDADAIENITIHDNDTESNTVTLTNIINHTGTTTLDGGTEGNVFTIAGTLNSAVVDASAQASDLRLTVGDTVGAIAPITQDVKLGTGDDVLTFANIDELDSTDSLTDAGGNDTVRAAFSADSNLDIDGIENLQVTATANVKLGMGNANIQNLVLLSNTAVDNTAGAADLDANGVQEPFGIVSSAPTNIITLDHSALTELNFFADADNNDANNGAAGVLPDDVVAHTFNGVTLSDNSATDITVNVNTSLDYSRSASMGGGAATYTIGQITSHGNTSMDIQVGNERLNSGTTTTINNIYAKNMETLTATATGNLTLGTVSGAALNNSLKTFDMSNVVGNVTANVISLGDNAVVTLADGNNVVSALGSAGKDVTMTAGNGNNTLTGTAQDDTITTGSGWDTIAGDRGDNVITAGAGNDTVTAKDGSDTIDLGTGIDVFRDNVDTGIDESTATNTVSMSGGLAFITIDVKGDDTATGVTDNVDQMLAVGDGSDLTVSWTGSTMNATTAVLDGGVAVVTAGSAATTATANSDLNIITTGGVSTVAASAGNDVTIFTGSVAGTDGLTFNGGAGNDAAVATLSVDAFTGGAGADKFVMQDTNALDGNTDRIVIADGDSTASAWDVAVGFDYALATGGSLTAAVGAATAGADVLDLDSTTIAAAADSTVLTTNITTASGIVVDDLAVSANGLATFNDNSVVGVGGVAVNVGTASTEVSLEDALSALAVELNGTSKTVAFLYDANGDGAFTAADSTFVFQDGVNDTVIELAGIATATGLEAVGGGTANLIEIG